MTEELFNKIKWRLKCSGLKKHISEDYKVSKETVRRVESSRDLAEYRLKARLANSRTKFMRTRKTMNGYYSL